MKKFAVLLSLLYICANIYGDEVNLSIEKFAEKEDTIISTDEVSKEKIENKNAAQALEVLSTMPGVFVQKTGDMGRSDPVIRGFGDSCRRIVVLIDGKPEKMSLFGCGVSHSMLAGNIERIEVIKGPDGVLFGSGALGGAINIITKMPAQPLEGSIDVSFGSFNTQNAKLYLGGIQNNILYEIAANKIVSDGHLENSQYNASDYYEKIGYIFNDGSMIAFEAKQFSGLKHEPAPYADGYWEDYQRGSVQVNYDKTFSRSDLVIKGYRNYGDHQFSDGWHSKDSLTGAMVNYGIEIGNDNTLKTGAELRQQEGQLLEGSSMMVHDGWKTSDWSIFALDQHNFTDKFSAVLGARYNNDEISGDFFAPRAGIEYKITNIVLVKALYSKGFRSPYLNELYLVPARNPNLKPEEINNYEIGVDIKSNNFNFNVTGFIMKGDNLIQTVENKIKPPIYTFRNTGEYEFKGSEISMGYIFNKYVSANAGYTYFDAGKHTQGRPESKIDADVIFKAGKWRLGIDGMYVGEYYASDKKQNKLKDFTVINTKLTYEMKEGVKLFVDGQNITNQDYQMFLDRDNGRILQMPGAAVYFGTQIKF